ncbi:MAG: hypothetical protein LBV55_00340 [Acholeplasmatales bacterium]|jgi:hypothetical protein|nr:hypothetical protein [Acholeplasmatales bacterium]
MANTSKCFKCKAGTAKEDVPTILGDIVYIASDENVYLHTEVEGVKVLKPIKKLRFFSDDVTFSRVAKENYCLKLGHLNKDKKDELKTIPGDIIYISGELQVYLHVSDAQGNKRLEEIKKKDFN